MRNTAQFEYTTQQLLLFPLHHHHHNRFLSSCVRARFFCSSIHFLFLILLLIRRRFSFGCCDRFISFRICLKRLEMDSHSICAISFPLWVWMASEVVRFTYAYLLYLKLRSLCIKSKCNYCEWSSIERVRISENERKLTLSQSDDVGIFPSVMAQPQAFESSSVVGTISMCITYRWFKFMCMLAAFQSLHCDGCMLRMNAIQ